MGQGREDACDLHICTVDSVDVEPHRLTQSIAGADATSHPICKNGEEEREEVKQRKDSEHQHDYQLICLKKDKFFSLDLTCHAQL